MLIQLSPRRETGAQDLVALLSECHQRIRSFLELARRAAADGAPAEQVTRVCAEVERYFVEALPLHVADEEESILPRLRGRSWEVDRALDTMTNQHSEHTTKLDTLIHATVRVRNEPEDRQARGALASAVAALAPDFEEHLAQEELVIFPAIRELLSAETQSTIVMELRQRRRSGWTHMATRSMGVEGNQ